MYLAVGTQLLNGMMHSFWLCLPGTFQVMAEAGHGEALSGATAEFQGYCEYQRKCNITCK